MSIQKDIDVNVPAKEVWPYFTEPEKIMQWCFSFKKFEYTTGQHGGTGAPIYIEEQAGGPLMKMNFEITVWKEDEKISLRMVSGQMLKSYIQSWSVAAIPSGSRITIMEDVEFGMGIFGKLLGIIQAKASLKSFDKMLAKLKILVEA